MMRKLALGLLACFLLHSPVQAQGIGGINISCTQVFQVSQNAVALTKIITSSNRVISLCGWVFNAGAATATVQLQSGTGTNCGSNNAAVTPNFALGINGVLVDHIITAHVSLPPNNDLCLVTTGTGPMQVMIYYTVN